MISTDDRSPSGRDSATSRLNSNHFNNNNNEENSNLYYQYVPERENTLSAAHSTPVISISSPPSSPELLHRHHNNQQQIILRDPSTHTSLPHLAGENHSISSSALALPSNSPPAVTTTTNGLTDFIHHTLSSRLIPKLGSIVKRFSLNYSGEGLVTDRQRTRTVRVGIRFQVQVDSFVNNRSQERPRAILRTQSAPTVEALDSGFSSPTTDVFPTNNKQLALEYPSNTCAHSNSSSTLSVADCSSSNHSSSGTGGVQIGIGHGVDSCSSGVSSESTSPVLRRRVGNNFPLPSAQPESNSNSNTLAFHNRINQALNSYRKNQEQQSEPRARRSSVHVYRRGSASPERSSTEPDHSQTSNSCESSAASAQNMEDASSFQVLRHFPGSNVNSLNELSWETAAFEKEIRDRIQWLGDKMSSIRVPRIISQLLDFGREYARENPVTALILLALCLTSSAPVLIFLVFAVATILVTFLGFLFVEGTLLTAGTVIFGGVIILVGFATLTAVLLGMLGYSATTEAYLVVTGRSRIFRLLRKIPIVGHFFPDVSGNSEAINPDQLADQEYSGLAKGTHSNGNGYGPYHHVHAGKSTPYYVEEEDDDDDDVHEILDSDDEVQIHEELVKKAEQEDLKIDEAGLSNATTTSDLTTSSDLGEEDDDSEEDLGNQEIVNGEEEPHQETLKTNGEVEKVSSSPIPLVNGHHRKENDSIKGLEEEHENAEESVA